MKYMDEKEKGKLMFRRVEEYGWLRDLNDVEMINEDEEVGEKERKENLMGKEDNGNKILRKDENGVKKIR